jgi:hypothetical protein
VAEASVGNMVSQDHSPREASLAVLGPELRFIGKPAECLGRIHLVNRSPEKLRLKNVPLTEARLSGPFELSMEHLPLFAKLLPGMALQVPVLLPIPLQTPPGRYTAVAVVDGREVPVTVDVLESWDITVIPTEISLKLAKGSRATIPIQLTNRGNMSWSLPRAAFAPLSERDGLHRNAFLALKNAPEASAQSVADEFVKRMQETEVEPARIEIRSGVESLSPGATEEVEIEITLPDNLKKNRLYDGSISFERSHLRLDIEILNHSAQSE